MIDPGPDVEHHVRALASSVAAAEEVGILLTHGHGDHAGAARALASATGARIFGPEGLDVVDVVLQDGETWTTDHGDLVALHTPGHTPEHVAFHWQDARALFVGDLFLGIGDTTWVAEYSGCVADYLGSLDRLRQIELDVLYPAHGPPLEDPADAIERFERHRRSRIEQARRAVAAHPQADVEQLVDLVYGKELPSGLRNAALLSLGALVEYVRNGEEP